MGRKAFTPEQIVFKLRGVEVLVEQGESISLACRKIAVAEQMYYRWQGRGHFHTGKRWHHPGHCK